MRRRDLLVVCVLIALHLAATARWLAADEGVQYTDAAYHYSQVLRLRAALVDPGVPLDALPASLEQQRYGSLFYVLAAGISLLTGPSSGPLIFGLACLLWPLLLFGGWQLGFELAPPGRRRLGGLFAAVVIGLLPGMFNYSRVLVLDLALSVAVLWALVGVLREIRAEDPRGRRRARALWIGAAIGGLLIKVNVLAFVVGPLWVLFAPEIRRSWREEPGRFLRRATVLMLPFVAAAAWLVLGPRGPALRRTVREATWPGAVLDYAANGSLALLPGHWLRGVRDHSWEAAYYTILQSLTPLWFLVLLLASGWFFARGRGCVDPLGRRQRDLVFWCFAVPTFGLLLLHRGDWDERYVLPLLPLFAALIASALADVPGPFFRNLSFGVLAFIGSLNALFISSDFWPTARPLACMELPGWASTERVADRISLCATYPRSWFMDRKTAPQHREWRLDLLEERLAPLRRQHGEPLRVVFLDQLDELFYAAYNRDLGRDPLFRHGDALLVTRCADPAWMRAMFETPEEVERQIRAADVVLVRWGQASPGAPSYGRRCEVLSRQREYLTPLARIDLRDGTELRIFTSRELRAPGSR